MADRQGFTAPLTSRDVKGRARARGGSISLVATGQIRHPRRLRIDSIGPGHVQPGLGCLSQRMLALRHDAILRLEDAHLEPVSL